MSQKTADVPFVDHRAKRRAFHIRFSVSARPPTFAALAPNSQWGWTSPTQLSVPDDPFNFDPKVLAMSCSNDAGYLALPLPSSSAESVGFSAERLARLDSAMQAEVDAGHYAAISCAIARHGKLVKFRSYGYQSLESRAPLRDDAIFRIASMTK